MDRKIEKKKWPPKKIAIYAGGGLILFIILYSFIFSDKSSRLNVEEDKITISSVKYGPFQEYIPITGTVQPIETFLLDVSDGGKVVTKYIEEGAFVNAGDPILKLDNASLTLNIIYNEANVFQQINSLRSTRLAMEESRLSLQGQLLDINHSLKLQKTTYENNKVLFDKNLVSKIEYENAKDEYEYLLNKKNLTLETFRKDSIFRTLQVEQLEKSVSTLEENLNITKKQLEDLTVKAPITGQLTSLNAEIGQSIAPGANVGEIDVVDSFKVRAAIDEHYIARVSPGQTGEFTLSDHTYRLIIKKVFPEVKNGQFEVDMNFNGEVPKGIRRGQSVQIRLELGELSQALTIDRGGFYQTTGGQWIFVLDPSGDAAYKRDIKLGRQNSSDFEVLEGLKKGEKVITSSYDTYGDVDKLVFK
ncbi:MAG TPA: HlyD family efflux transporter periplasmic adaptor subunit [Ignavibacteriaceae bacterium]|nr:HlyD family efflux transporter periplasmic adaptor subunit [Ignavibacteriaceae bacterium]